MIVCRKCGFKNVTDDTFCGSCGTFLEWTGEKVERKVAPAIAEEVEAEVAKPRKGLMAKLQDIIYSDVGDRDPVERAAKPGLGGGGGLGGAARPGGLPSPPGGGGLPKPSGLGGGLPGAPPGGGLPKPPGLGGLPKPSGLGGGLPGAPPGGGLPKPPGLGGLPKPPGLGGLPKPPGLGGLPKPPGLGGLPAPSGLGGLPKPPGLGDSPAFGAPPRPPGLSGLSRPPLPPKPPSDEDDDEDFDPPRTAGSPSALVPAGAGGAPKLPPPPGLGGLAGPPGALGKGKGDDDLDDDLDDLDDDEDDLDDDFDDDFDDEDDDEDEDDPVPAKPAPPRTDPSALVAPLSAPAAALSTVAPATRSAVLSASTAGLPEAVAPQASKKKTRTITKTAPSRRFEEGDLVCGECGEGNPPTRKFCSRCGTSLSTAEIVKLAWWRRIFRSRKRNRVLDAGKRPGRDGVKARKGFSFRAAFVAVRRVVVVALVLATVAYGFIPQFRTEVDRRAVAGKQAAVGWFTPTYDPIRPIAVSATSELEGSPALSVSDGATNTAWAAEATAPDPALVMTFDRPVDFVRAIVHNGQENDFATEDRARLVHIVYSTGKTEDVTLKDAPDAQEVELKEGKGATSVELHVQQLYPAVRGTKVVISEIELFVKR
ncbi:zinc ribbon domain-containing protein [Umezawaea sp. Da 62-37]|uniref:zinc ribbon domain-containing protein n=1 Tax=Umezawaea sp. Da 62-37 TaxID=3075927 RepID=UPI0028F6E23E|nr:zinc ribbon domain-containing protein [Umezawaea sp. Da 62-37]WNV87974.1 zinc ribbon domain-containing protein [Umezawaea sp. Da 62-37]